MGEEERLMAALSQGGSGRSRVAAPARATPQGEVDLVLAAHLQRHSDSGDLTKELQC